MREKDIEKYLVKRVELLAGEVRKVRWVNRNSAPDRLVMLPRREIPHRRPSGHVVHSIKAPQTIWVELKAPGEEPTPAQAREHKRLRDMGQRVEVVDSIERVDEVLR